MSEESIFAEAIGKPIEERKTFLDEACGSDADLRERVEKLLKSHDETGSFLAKPAEEDMEATMDLSASVIQRITAPAERHPVAPDPDEIEPESPGLAEQEPGERVLYFGDYKLQGEIARGAMGVVYRAEQKSLKRTVAIKMIRSTILTNELDVFRFKAEAEAAASLDHPNIVPIYEVGMHEGQHYFTMKLIHGGTLRDHLERLQKDPKVAAKLMATVAGAIHVAHQRGILHRDLKPGNILVDEDGEPHVTDFGLAKQMESNSSVTLSGQIMGTPQYMAPEQAEGGGRELTTAVDVYGLGAIFYEMLCGKPPHVGSSLMDTLRLVVEEQAVPPSRRNSKVDRDLETIAMKCLDKDPIKRYASAQELKNDLDRWLRGEPIEARPVGTAEKILKWMKRKPMHAAAAVLGVLLLVTLGVGGPIAAWQQSKLKDEADSSRSHAEQKEGEARQALARSALSLAEAALREGNGLAMQAALKDVPENYRGSTWRYLLDQSDRSIARIDMGAEIHSVVAHPRLPHVFAMVESTGKVTVLNVNTGVRLLEFVAELSSKGIYCMAISQNGEYLAIGSKNEADDLVIHNSRDGKRLRNWKANGTHLLNFSPDGKTLLQAESGPESYQLNLRDVPTGDLRWSVESGYVGSGSFTANGQKILVASGMRRLLSSQNGSPIPGHVKIPAIRADAGNDGKIIISGNLQGIVTGKYIENGSELFEIRTEDRPIKHLAFTADGDRFISISELSDGRQAIRLWDAKTGAPLQSLLGGVGPVLGASVHPLSGELVVCGSETRVWTVGPNAKWTMRGDGSSAIGFFGSDDVVYAPSKEDGFAIQSLDSTISEAFWSQSGQTHPDFNVSADGQYAALATSSGPILFLRRSGDEFEQVATFQPAKGGKLVRLSPRGERLVSFNRNWWKEPESVSVINTMTGDEITLLERLDFNQVSDFAWINEQRLLGLVTSQARRGTPESAEQIVLWDIATGNILKTAGNSSPMYRLAVAPDRQNFAEAGEHKQVRIRDSATLEIVHQFRAHEKAITAVAWHPTRPILATGSNDLAIRLWHLETGELIEEMRLPIAAPHDLVFSPSGHRLGCASEDATTRIWELPSLKFGDRVVIVHEATVIE